MGQTIDGNPWRIRCDEEAGRLVTKDPPTRMSHFSSREDDLLGIIERNGARGHASELCRDLLKTEVSTDTQYKLSVVDSGIGYVHQRLLHDGIAATGYYDAALDFVSGQPYF